MRRLNKTYPYQKQLKNRSSKDIDWLTGPGTKPIERSMSNECLKSLVSNCKNTARWEAELSRRAAKRDKRENKTAK